MHGILSVLFRVVQLAFAGASSVLVPAYEAISFLSRTAPASYILWEGASEVPLGIRWSKEAGGLSVCGPLLLPVVVEFSPEFPSFPLPILGHR